MRLFFDYWFCLLYKHYNAKQSVWSENTGTRARKSLEAFQLLYIFPLFISPYPLLAVALLLFMFVFCSAYHDESYPEIAKRVKERLHEAHQKQYLNRIYAYVAFGCGMSITSILLFFIKL
jgi:hypothetical protein